MTDTDINNINNINNIIDNNNNNKLEEEEKKPNCIFKKPIKQRNNIRKKPTTEEINKKEQQEEEEEKNNSDDNEEEKNKKKKIKINQYTTKSEKKNEFSFESTGIAGSSINTAELSTTEFHNEEDEYEKTVLESRGLKKQDLEKQQQQQNNDDGIYRGLSSYSTFTPEKKSDLSYKGGGVKAGPIKTVANVRLSSRIDYQPDVCKDYKQTGQCTFGDACKFLHDRSDYKSGWQIDKDWEEEQKLKRLGKDSSSTSSSSTAKSVSDELPFACFICKNQFNNPVMTKCKHYFCEGCALEHNKKNKKCALCNEPTQGLFSCPPKKTLDRLLELSKSHFNK